MHIIETELTDKAMYRNHLSLLCLAVLLTGLAGCDPASPDTGQVTPELEVYPEELQYDPDDPDANIINITSNVAWRIEMEDGLDTDWKTGNAGRSTVMVTSAPEGTSTLSVYTVSGGTGEKPIVREVTVINSDNQEPDPEPEPDPGPQDVIFYDDLDGGTPPESNSWIDTWTGFINATGSGAADIEYSGRGFQSRDTYPSRSYEGASGGNAFYSTTSGATVEVSGITIPAGETTFRFSFGSLGDMDKGSFTANEDITLTISDGSGRMQSVDYRRSSSTHQWALCEMTFSITGTAPRTLSFLFTAGRRNIRIDDIRLETSGGQPDCEISFEGTSENIWPWAELPETVTENPDYRYITHYATTVRSNQKVRNFVSCYDTSRHNPMWVAHIHHSCYYEGGWGRSDPDPWRPDPEMAEQDQSIIYPYDWERWYQGISGWPDDDRYYWSPVNFNLPVLDGREKTITKGHMLRSADRGGAGEEINIQTFYPSNISPELYLHSNTWSIVEDALSDEWTCSDTTYVVTGCYYGDDVYELIDASSWGTPTTGRSKTCIMPVARYRVVLRTKDGNTGKPVAECSADELISIGFWFPQAFNGQTIYEETDKSEWIFSVADIEEMIGGEFSFFPTVPEEVKHQRNLADWGL